MTTHEEIAQLLDRAHDEVLIRGWCQGALRGKNGEVCAVGALYVASGQEIGHPECSWTDEAMVAHSMLGRTVGNIIVPDWNDTPGRTIDDVLDAFRHAAKDVRELAS